MTKVKRNARVLFEAWRNDKGHEQTGQGSGLVLDRGPDAGTWWVSVPGSRRAVLVSARQMREDLTR